MSASPIELSELQKSPCYPFDLAGRLCPLLDNGELLLAFYEGAGSRLNIKQYCKRATWPGKPAVGFAIDPAKLQELVASLFNTPAAREQLRSQGDDGRCPFLHNAIWAWLGVENPTLVERIAGCCETIDDRSFIRVEPLNKLLAEIQPTKPDAREIIHLAYAVLAFAILQPDDRHALGQVFLSAFPEYLAKFCGAAQP